ncbi:MAG: hypothetical protein ACLSVD_02285 [Eggerthellaceae bacterium]
MGIAPELRLFYLAALPLVSACCWSWGGRPLPVGDVGRRRRS